MFLVTVAKWRGKESKTNWRNISLIIYRTAEEIRKHVLKPRPFVILRVQGIIDKIKHFVRLLDSGHLHLAPVICFIIDKLHCTLKYGMTSVFDRVLISNTTICNVCQGWPVSTAYFILKLGTRMFTWIVKFSSCHMKKEALHCFRVARSNRRINSILVHLQVQWLMK